MTDLTSNTDRPNADSPGRANGPGKPQSAAAARMRDPHRWAELQVRQAIARGEFDDLPGAGKPIEDLTSDGADDPDWWLKRLIAREQITGVLPAALQLRKDDLTLDDQLDRESHEDGVRRLLEEFNRSVVEARRQLQGGPPVVTPTRDVEREVERWVERREERREAQRAALAAQRRSAAEQSTRAPRAGRRRLRRRRSRDS